MSLKQSSIAHFAIDGLFWLRIVASPRLIRDTWTRGTGIVTSYSLLFLHAQIGAKAIFTSE